VCSAQNALPRVWNLDLEPVQSSVRCTLSKQERSYHAWDWSLSDRQVCTPGHSTRTPPPPLSLAKRSRTSFQIHSGESNLVPPTFLPTDLARCYSCCNPRLALLQSQKQHGMTSETRAGRSTDWTSSAEPVLQEVVLCAAGAGRSRTEGVSTRHVTGLHYQKYSRKLSHSERFPFTIISQEQIKQGMLTERQTYQCERVSNRPAFR
jgi:hypothetical protein